MTGAFRFAFRGRVSPRQATYFLLLRQKKVSKEKATLLSASLRFATGNLRCSRFAGSRRTRFAQTAASPDPRNAPLLGAARGAWEPTGPSLRSALGAGWAFAALGPGTVGDRGDGEGRCHSHSHSHAASPQQCQPLQAQSACSGLVAERSNGPCGFPIPSGRAEERSVSRIRARPCLSEASLGETPRDVSTAGCPQRSGGTRPVGSPFLWQLSFGEAKESSSPAGARPGLGKQPQDTAAKGASR
jgi:hypothetical protein